MVRLLENLHSEFWTEKIAIFGNIDGKTNVSISSVRKLF